MKIEKVNDHQIRCTLTREDLADRELKLSELAYGTEKAKDLFRDMMQQASFEFGFEAEDIPLMIEAIPLNSECIVLIITKVEDPDELDTRFSKFAPSVHEDGNTLDDVLDTIAEGADDVLDLFRKIQNNKSTGTSAENAPQTQQPEQDAESTKRSFKNALQKKLSDTAVSMELTRIYTFRSLREITDLAHVLSGFYNGANSLYKQKDNTYILVLSKSSHTPVEFNKVCNILSEYGSCIKSVPASEAYLEEHFEPIVKNTALQSLSCI
ncbi:adaptor protein MecA [Parablautia intestinalis]|jgi:adapter protein MecA 1/2|uniref:Adaptor protein MecA n=1 Tax=Parablautia intestinalis TaxID=2320100 RepID=A0A3A9AGK0_9FIRM|nr:adaptor protein MecA [Parablautia intestinalis]MCI8614883.1 adaptor protein MecA [Lachnospiraceae bacterium]MDE7047340.1 adaptor protein MecA [Lachnospiraceae bacterium]RKI90527.1 adaptor protein MecA [Parablautia intestinalis]